MEAKGERLLDHWANRLVTLLGEVAPHPSRLLAKAEGTAGPISSRG